ncbi:MAG: aminopeptidase [Sphingomonas bacterium]|uniref:M28 family peptidase n=1 Tax=Sphingomonas bacterium TaxID=1895847 RepID=UPI00261C92B2|nr:M28 family peptidase [Sphingomonas bacterium]MDB5705154.1 aminopeptidase [Sphingomonas bacterium]
MLRSAGAIALMGFAGAALAQASAAAAPNVQTREPAEINAIVNAALPDDQAAMKAHVMFLASDAMRGREAGSPEFDIAAQYVAAQFYAAGLRPAGDDGGYLQKVPLLTYRAADKGDLVLTRKGAEPLRLAFGDDYVPGANAGAATTALDAPVVFVGYGIVAPQYQRNDYAGVDVKGKIVAYFGGAPDSFQSEERAHFAGGTTKAILAESRGAVGTILIQPRSLVRAAQGWDRGRVTWGRPDGTGDAPGAPQLATLSDTGAAKLFAGAKTPWATIVKRAGDDEASFKAEQLPGSLAVSLKTAFTPGASSNVAGIIPGSDPKLGNEVVILSAHLDHLGVRPDMKGDNIFNGAEDNAIGIASLIEEAKRFKASGKAPRRSVMFLAVTAEEKGLIGSSFFSAHPTVPVDRIVADVNLDMPVLNYKFEDMIVFGADRSSLGPIVSKAVGALGVTMSPDPMPAEAFFVRSDHYNFVRRGIPSVFLWPGQAGPGKAAFNDFYQNRYHKPSDDLTQPIDWSQGIRFVDVNYAIAREIADGDARPRWNKGDFFGTLYNGYGAK